MKMAEKKRKTEPAPSKPIRTTTEQRAAPAAEPNSETRRLLREAAWTRMFGKAGGSKNPFAR